MRVLLSVGRLLEVLIIANHVLFFLYRGEIAIGLLDNMLRNDGSIKKRQPAVGENMPPQS